MGITTVLTLVFLIVFIGYKILRNLWERLMLSDLNKRHVFITGCDTGFGHILAFKLASLRIPVIAACYTQKVSIFYAVSIKNFCNGTKSIKNGIENAILMKRFRTVID